MMNEEELIKHRLIEATLSMLENRSVKIMLKQIVAEVNNGVEDKKERITIDWLYKFKQGTEVYDDPKHPKVINKIERLNKYLVSKLNPTLT